MAAKTMGQRGLPLATLLDRAGISHPVPPGLGEVRGLAMDSRQVQPGDLFIGLPGERVDGGCFWRQAVAAGAMAALISERAAQQTQAQTCEPVLRVPEEQIPQLCAQVAAAFYDFPGQQLALVGVTGTNGKTTTTHLIEYLLNAADRPAALIGTLCSRWLGQEQMASYTTPFAIDLQRILAEARDQGVQQGVLEVSSHALAQQRVWGCQFAVAVWTNLTQDHLDFHPTLEAYWQAKATLFRSDYLRGRAIINQDDPGGQRVLQQLRAGGSKVAPWSYSLKSASAQPADLWPQEVELAADQIQALLQTPQGKIPIQVPMAGAFNLANLMAAVGAVLHLGVDPELIATVLPSFPGVPGRMEMVQISEPASQDLTVIVDYAHTPDGVLNLLRAVRPTVQGQLICVLGCGGDRDRSKRPQMGRIAAEWSDRVVVTSDNPRTEDPQQILRDILNGFDAQSLPTQVEMDRRVAITEAILGANPGDTVVIAGKGHEDYQILGTTKVHFDDREVARQALQIRRDL